jgi:hypothetical protein
MKKGIHHMPVSPPAAFFDQIPGIVLIAGGCFAVFFLSVVALIVRSAVRQRRQARAARREAQAIVAMGHAVTATITGIREEHTQLYVGKSPVLEHREYRTSTNYVLTAIWRDPRTGQEVTFVKRSPTRDRYAIGSPVTVYVDPNNSARYVIP